MTGMTGMTGMAGMAGMADRDYPQMAVEVNHVEPAPRRVRGYLGNELIFDTTGARYVWEIPYYPQYYIPVADIDARFLTDEGVAQSTRRGPAHRHGLQAGGQTRPGAVRLGAGPIPAEHQDLAWSYNFPTRQLLPIANLIAFYNEKLDLEVDGRPLPRPHTHFS